MKFYLIFLFILKVTQIDCLTHPSLSEANETLISLIPKRDNIELVAHFRPIALCTVHYECLTKLIATRLRGVMNDLISPFQSRENPIFVFSSEAEKPDAPGDGTLVAPHYATHPIDGSIGAENGWASTAYQANDTHWRLGFAEYHRSIPPNCVLGMRASNA